MPPHETPNYIVMSESPVETDSPLHVSIKNDSQVISEFCNSYDYTQYIEWINLEGHSEHTYDVDGPVLLRDVASDTHKSVSSKYERIDAVATSVKSSLCSQDKETVSQIHYYCNHSKDIQYMTMKGHSEHIGSDDRLVPLCNATSNSQISVYSKTQDLQQAV